MAKTTKPHGATPAAKAPSKKKKTGSKAGDPLKAKQAAAGPARQPGVERRKNHPLRAKNGHFHVLLTQPVPHVGQPGELVSKTAISIPASPNSYRILYFWTTSLKFGVWAPGVAPHPALMTGNHPRLEFLVSSPHIRVHGPRVTAVQLRTSVAL